VDLDKRVSELRSVSYVTVRPKLSVLVGLDNKLDEIPSPYSRLNAKGDIGGAVLDRDLLRHVLSNFRQQLAWAVRFRHAVVTADRPRLLFFATERIGRDRDDRDRSQGGIGLDLARGGVAIHDRQLDIHQNEIGRLLCDCRKRLLAVFGLRDFVVGRGEHIANDLAIIRLVLDH
jgi:hypothetical protein